MPVKILVVEDNFGDVRLFLNEFKELSIFTEFQVVTNGVEDLQFLQQKNDYNDVPKPDLLVLDLYLPKKDGIEVLSKMSKDQHLK
ncbi:MAG: response regulator [Methanobacterium sp.]